MMEANDVGLILEVFCYKLRIMKCSGQEKEFEEDNNGER